MSIVEKFVRIGESKAVGATRRLFMTVAEGAVLFTVASWALILALVFVTPRAFMSDNSTPIEIVAILVAVFVPDSLAVWWIFRRIRANRSRDDARRAATAFAVSAPVVLAIGHPLGLLVGGYAEVVLGSRFVLPTLVAFIILLMVFIPNSVVWWALHPSGGVGPVGGSDQE